MLGAMENKQLSVVSVELMPVRGCMMKKCLADEELHKQYIVITKHE